MTDFDISGLSDLTNRTVSTGDTISSSDHEAWRNDVESRTADLNDAAQALLSNRAGASSPTNNTVQGAFWYDTANSSWKGDPDGSGADSDLLYLDGGSGVKASLWPSFEVTLSGNQAIGSTDPVKVQWDTETFDTNSDFDSTTNYRFTPTVAGKFLLTATVYMISTNDEPVHAFLYKNGSQFREVQSSVQETDASGASRSATFTCIVDANGTTDYFEVYVDSFLDSSYSIDASIDATTTWFAGSRIA